MRNSLRKTCVDIPGYIAEGSGKTNDADFGRSLSAALGFANRLEYYALLSHDLTFLKEAQYIDYQAAIVEVKKMLNKLIGQLVVR